jgi:PAS domain S-box-containing protein
MPLSNHRKLQLYAYLGPLPAVVCSLWLLWGGEHAFNTRLTLSVLVLGCWLACSAALLTLIFRPLQTAANLLSALREGDFSIRASRARGNDPLGELYSEINLIGNILRTQRLNAMEATALVSAMMEAIDVAVFAFDEGGCLRLANPAAQRLLGFSTERLLGQHASRFGLAACLEGDPVRVLSQSPFPSHAGSWGLRRCSFREQGRPHTLVLLADLSQALRDEKVKAWQSLVRVLGHELNNSLAPIKSIAGSLGALLRRQPRAEDWEDDLRSGLDIIGSRADGLTRFLQAYSQLARLPAPSPEACSLARLVRQAAALEGRLQVSHEGSADLTLRADPAQLGLLLTNLIRNATEAALLAAHDSASPAEVRIAWTAAAGTLTLTVTDNGIGISNTANLFVPFFTTKPEGSGIGLVLSRQIAENHGGSLGLANRTDGVTGCVATLALPLR